MALALNSFLPWHGHMAGLRLCGTEGFTDLQFDGRCPTGVRGTPPHVDVIAAGAKGVVGACVRVYDYLGLRPSDHVGRLPDRSWWARACRPGRSC